MDSFEKFYNKKFKKLMEEKLKNNLIENTKKSGMEVIKSRILKYRDLGENVEVDNFSYVIDEKNDAIKSIKLNVKIGTKVVKIEFKFDPEITVHEQIFINHSLKDTFDYGDPDYVYQINFLYHLVNDYVSYFTGIKNACINLINQIEKIKNNNYNKVI